MMALSTSGTSVAVFTCLWMFVLTEDQQQITVKTGDDVTLQCLDHRGGDVKLLEWRRHDQNVFVWKDGNKSEDDHHPSFKNRVELRDPQMKDGDVSVILKNVTINDNGTYECRVKNNTPTPPQIINITTLTVTDQQQTVKTGDDVTLQCLDHRGGDVTLLEWRRHDQNVFVWKDGNKSEDDHDPSFKNRVELREPQMKDGDVSVILKNVTINDTGTYECRVKNNNTPTPPQIINITTLTVTDSGADKDAGDKDGGDKDGLFILIVSVVIVSLLLLVGIVFMVHRKRICHVKKTSDVPPPDEPADQQPT